MKSKKIRVMLVDDHGLIREGIKQILELEKDIVVVGQAGDGEEAFVKVEDLKPDIILLDINMPKVNGIEALRRFKDIGIESKIIMLTIHEDKEYIMETMKLGADGYILKDSSADCFIKAIRDVLNGKEFIQPKITNLANNGTNGEDVDICLERINSLTKREYEVLTLIAEGLNNRDIATKIFISEKTVKNHVSSIFKKLKLNDRVQAAIFAYKNNIKKGQL